MCSLSISMLAPMAPGRLIRIKKSKCDGLNLARTMFAGGVAQARGRQAEAHLVACELGGLD